MLQTPATEQTGWEFEPATCAGQAAQVAPHWAAVWATQAPPQMCRLAPQVVSQIALALHVVPGSQGEQSTLSSVPQVALAVLRTHAPPQR